MEILYTYQGLMQKVGGVTRYFYENIIRIRKECNINICTYYLSNEYFRRILQKPTFEYSGWQNLRVRNFIEDINMAWHLLTDKYDLVHLTAEESQAINFSKSPIVITIHDMVPELFYNDRKRIQKRKTIIHHASAIICVSRNTKQDLLRIYPEIDEKKIFVIYHGYSPQIIDYFPLIKDKYILFVGSRYGEYKNFLRFLSSISSILKSYNIKLVCTGQKFSPLEKQKIEEYGITDKIHHAGYVSDEQLANLYHYAECFVYPSLYEGFGIPILESFSHGCPACISNTSCFPEVALDAASYFDPNDEQSIRSSITSVLNNPSYRMELVKRGYERLHFFSWDKAAKATIQVYKNVIYEKNKKSN